MNDPNATTDQTNPTPAAPAASGALDIPAEPSTALGIAQALSAGRIDSIQAGRLAKAGGIDALTIARAFSTLKNAELQSQDLRTSEDKAADALYGQPAQPQDYIVNWQTPGRPQVVVSKEMEQWEQQRRGNLSDAGCSREVGNAVIQAVSRAADTISRMTPEQILSYRITENDKLAALFPDEATLDRKLTAAGEMVKELETRNPGLQALLRGPVGDTAAVALLLIQIAERYWMRKGRTA